MNKKMRITVSRILNSTASPGLANGKLTVKLPQDLPVRELRTVGRGRLDTCQS